MKQRYDAIQNFLTTVKETKGLPEVQMEAAYKTAADATARGVIASGGFQGLAARDAGTQRRKHHVHDKKIADPAHCSSRFDGALHIGETIRFTVTIPVSGYLRLFNFGSSGRCLRLFPGPYDTDVFFHGGERFLMPEQGPWFMVNGPATAQNNAPDRLFALVIQDKEICELEHLDPRLEERTRGGFGGQVEKGRRAPLFSLDSANWEYGLLQYEIKEQGVKII